MKDLPKTWVSSNNQLTILDQKIQKILSFHGEQNIRNIRPQSQKLNVDHVTRKKKNWSKFEKSVQIKILGTLQD